MTHTVTKNGYTFNQMDSGTVTCTGQLQSETAPRSRYLQRTAGGDQRVLRSQCRQGMTPDEGGHLVAAQANGPAIRENLFAQNHDLNHGAFYALEQGEQHIAAQGGVLQTQRTAFVSSQRSDAGLRPDAFLVSDQITYPDGQVQSVHLSFQNLSSQVQDALARESAPLLEQEPDPAPGPLRASMSSAEFTALMEQTDADLPSIADELEEAQVCTSPQPPGPDSAPDPGPEAAPDNAPAPDDGPAPDPEACPSNQALIDGIQAGDRLRLLDFLARFAPDPGVLRYYFEYDPQRRESYRMPKRGSDILFFLQNVLAKFTGSSFCPEEGMDTLHDYLSGCCGRRLFLIHDQESRDSSRLFAQYVMKRLGNAVMSQSRPFQGRMLWVLDEIDKLGGDIGLTEAATLGQQFGLQLVLSTQSLESLYALAPSRSPEHIARAALAGFPLLAAFHPGDPQTVEILQQLFGTRRRPIVTLPLSRYDRPEVRTELLPVVDDQSLSSLGVGQCYVKLRNAGAERVQICP